MVAHAPLEDAGHPPAPTASDMGESPCDHERLLARHGLISHIVDLSPEATDAEMQDLVENASRLAMNTIRLAERRFGVLFDSPDPPPISDASYDVRPAGAATPTETQDRDADTTASARQGAGSPHNADTLAHAEMTGTPTPADAEPAATLLARIESQLAGLSARLDEATPAALADQIVPLVDELVTRRIEAEDRAHAETAQIRDAWKQDIAQFWDGMESVLRLLSTSASQISDTGKEISLSITRQTSSGSGDADLQAAIEEVKSAISESQNATETGLARVDASLAVATSDQADTLKDLVTAIDKSTVTQGQKLDDQTAQLASATRAVAEEIQTLKKDSKAIAATRSAQSAAAADLAKMANRLGSLENTLSDLSGTLAELKTAQEENARPESEDNSAKLGDDLKGLERATRNTSRMVTAMSGDLSKLLARPVPSNTTADEILPEFERMLLELKESMTERGGVLSDAMDASARSMKTFWIASEDALTKLKSELGRLEASQTQDLSDDLIDRLANLEARQHEANALAQALGGAMAEILAMQTRFFARTAEES